MFVDSAKREVVLRLIMNNYGMSNGIAKLNFLSAGSESFFGKRKKDIRNT